jgi:carbon monoxide dehydrogenase subunit G
MIIENEFTVDAAPSDVYELMLDVERIAPCLPGAELTGRRDNGSFDGQMTVKLGPMRMTYKGAVEITEHEPDTRRAVMLAKGADARGQGTASASVEMTVTETAGGGAHVAVRTDLQITGRVAQMGQGIMRDVATHMVGQMAADMERLLRGEAPGHQPDLKAGSVVAGVISDRTGRLVGRVRGSRESRDPI